MSASASKSIAAVMQTSTAGEWAHLQESVLAYTAAHGMCSQ